TGMVGEFPELQGIMGAYYAKAQGEDDAVIDALRMQYKPTGPDDIVPTKAVAIALGLADRLDMLAGFWSIDEKPTGSKDPFALRRASLAILRILEANKLKVSTQKLVREALAAQPNLRENDLDDLCTDLVSFVRDRAKVMFRDRDIRHDVADALLAKDDFVFADVASNAPSLDRFLVHEGKGLVALFKRARNILRQAEDYQNIHGFEGMEPAEERLKTSLNRAGQELEKSHDFTDKLTILSGLIAPMNDFFDSVVVNHEQMAIRARRLSLMVMVVELFDKVADFEALEG
ncbi:MAG: glycine--tRNA ligase subunit beta, partial [Rhodobacteraceae bacterium]|nr:glycine--tRNA ligase subunit beta [Paracoccaceae bacterium]